MAALKVLGVCLVSWLAGMSAYCFAWFRIEGRINTRELVGVVFWMAFATVPFVFFYGLAVSRVDRSGLRGVALAYGLACAVVGILPIIFLNLLFGNFSFHLLTAESLLAFAHFGTAGFTFGILYAIFLRDIAATHRLKRE